MLRTFNSVETLDIIFIIIFLHLNPPLIGLVSWPRHANLPRGEREMGWGKSRKSEGSTQAAQPSSWAPRGKLGEADFVLWGREGERFPCSPRRNEAVPKKMLHLKVVWQNITLLCRVQRLHI